MARLLKYDSFRGYNSSAEFGRGGWTVDSTSVITLSATDGRFSDPAMRVSNDNLYGALQVPGSPQTLILGVALHINLINVSAAFFKVMGGGANHVRLLTRTDGRIDVEAGGVVRGQIDWTVGTHEWLEIRLKVADAGGECTIRVNENQVFTFSGDTRNGGTGAVVDTIFLGGASQTARIHIWSHLIVGDDNVGADTAFFGDSRISRLAPTSDAQAQFTRSGGAANFEAVDEIPSDDDVTYVESSTVGQQDRYGLSDLSGTPVAIHGVGVKPLARDTDAGGGALKFGARSGATDSTTTIGLGSGYAFQTHLMRTDPATGVAWTKAGVDALQSLIEVA